MILNVEITSGHGQSGIPTAKAEGLAAEKVQSWLEGKNVRKVIVVPGRLVNIAVS